ncbi:hypothetical protein Bbelb_247490 [Branchiostoma belcheri]|nr:hypothetical protein Bbelb_247490 [Branchiostoma belcheri]
MAEGTPRQPLQGHQEQPSPQDDGAGQQGNIEPATGQHFPPPIKETNQPAFQATILERQREGGFGGATIRIKDRDLAAAAIAAAATVGGSLVASQVTQSPAIVLGTGAIAGAMSLAAFWLANRMKVDKAICKAVEKDGHIEVEKIEGGSLLVHVKFLSQAGYWVLRALNEKIHQGTDRTCLQLLLEDELRKIGWTGPIQVGLEEEAAGTKQLPPPDAEREAQGEMKPGQAGEYLLGQGGQLAPQAAGQAYQGPLEMQHNLQQAAQVRFHPEQKGYEAQAALFPQQGFPMPPKQAGQVYHNLPPASKTAANVGQLWPPALQMSIGGAMFNFRIQSPAVAAGGLVAGAAIGGAFAASRISESPTVVLGTGLAAGVATGVTTLAAFYLSNRHEAIHRVFEQALAYPEVGELAVAYPEARELAVAYPEARELAVAYPEARELAVAYPEARELAVASHPEAGELAVASHPEAGELAVASHPEAGPSLADPEVGELAMAYPEAGPSLAYPEAGPSPDVAEIERLSISEIDREVVASYNKSV